MKTIHLYQKIILAVLFAALMTVNGSSHVIEIHDGWILQGKYKATVPSTVMGVLTANGEYAGILEDTAYQDIDTTRFDHPWTYTNKFTLTQSDRSGHVFLQLDGISYRANIRINGTLIGDTSTVYGTYRRHRFDITSIAKASNTIEIELFRARKGEPNAGYVDWNPRPADESMGIIRPVSIITCGDVLITSPSVQSRVNVSSLNEAWLTLSTQMENLSKHKIEGELVGRFDGREFSYPVSLPAGESRLLNITSDDVKSLYVQNPRLWWCRGMGRSTELYDMQLSFIAKGKTEDSTSLKFGIRQIGGYFTKHGDRGFTLNGKRVLVRGGGWTDDIFMRDTKESNAEQLYKVCDMNLNAIRMENIWGKSQDIFDRCDSLGIMILPGWTCQWEWKDYLGIPDDELYGCLTTPKAIKLMTQYFKDQLLWLRSHPSIICWFVGSDKLPVPELEHKYHHLLHRFDPERPLITSAKKLESQLSGTAGMKMAGPYDYVGPGYWYSKEAPGGAFGFNTETGIGAQMPQKESLMRMIGKDLWPINDIWNYHCTASSSSMSTLDRLQKVISLRYGVPTGLDDFLHKADLANYESTRAMFESFRVNTPTATGIVQWMLNSARPSIYWQLYDYYGQPNASYYSVKKGNAPLQLIYNYASNKIIAVNGTLDSKRINADMKLYDLQGNLIAQKDSDITVDAQHHDELFDVPKVKGNEFLFLMISDANGNAIETNDYVLAEHMDEYDWKASNWITTPIKKYADYTSLASLPRVQLAVKASSSESDGSTTVKISLSNPTKIVALQIRLSITDKKGQLVFPAHYDDNYVTLQPCEHRTIECVLPHRDSTRGLKLKAEGWNVETLSDIKM